MTIGYSARVKTRTRKTKKTHIITPESYTAARVARGTQSAVADALGVKRETIARRETGARAITRESMLALLTLPELEVCDE